MENTPVLCFEHCQKGRRICCIAVPSRCPLCGKDLEDTPMRLPPFRLPSPFVSATEAPYSVLVKPTFGDFLRDYEKSADLHIGLSNSKGVVYEYNSRGLSASTRGWEQCLSISLLEQHGDLLYGSWDSSLLSAVQQPAWSPHRYDESHHNCYTFVLSLLAQVGLGDAYPCEGLAFCQKILLPHTSKAARYISLYRKILKEGTVVEGS